MFSQNDATSETTLLLERLRPADRTRSPSSKPFRLSPETLLIPVVLAANLGTQISTTTFIELIRLAVCRLKTISHGDPAHPVQSSELCDAPEIARSFSTVVAIYGAAQGILTMAQCGMLSHISSRYGRKPAFVLVLIASIAGSCLIPWSQYVPDWLAGWILLGGVLCQLCTDPLTYAYLVNMYIVDVCVPEDRTAALSKIGGWTMIATCISLALGGAITTKTGNPLIVYYIATAMFISAFIYVISLLPESFPEEKRNALSRLHSESEPLIHRTTFSGFFSNIFKPLKMLVPTLTSGGTRNWRLTWCALHIFVFITANSYTPSAWLVLVTSKYHLTPAETGIFFASAGFTGMFVLMVIVPPLVRFLRPYYNQTITRFPLVDESICGDETSALETSDRLDVHLAFASCIITGISFLCAAESTTISTLIPSGAFVGFYAIHTPMLRSLVAGSVNPLKQGEALAAIQMVHTAGTVVSPILMGGILSATIDSSPLLLFYVHLVVVPISGVLLFLVRDVDRYQSEVEPRVT